MPNVKLRPYARPAMWRKLSFANWREPRDPQVYGRVEVDMGRAIQFARTESERTGEKVTPTHLVVRALALALARCPEANVLMRWSRIYQREEVDIFCQVAIPGEKPDLSGATIRRADTKGPAELARELAQRAARVREGTDKELGATQRMLAWMPTFLARFVIWMAGLLSYTFNLDLRWLGLPRDPFGGAMVTSVGSLGIDEGYPPLVPMSRVSLLICAGRIEEKPVVRDGQIVIRPVSVLTCTFDHRLMDGLIAGRLATHVIGYLSDPQKHEGAAPGATDPTEAAPLPPSPA